jgi:uracil-DNA glycosylase family 4
VSNCPICGVGLIEPAGRETSDILLVGEYPGREDYVRGVPFGGDIGKLLSYELMRAGLDINQCRLTYLWQHPMNKDESCLNFMIRSLTLEMAGRKVLMMGSEMSMLFLNEKVTDLAGLVVTSALFPKSTKFVMFSQGAGYALHSTIGEVRLAISKFCKKIKEVV